MNEEAAGKGDGSGKGRGSEINEMTQLQYWKDKPDACWHGGMKQIWRHRRAPSLKLRRPRFATYMRAEVPTPTIMRWAKKRRREGGKEKRRKKEREREGTWKGWVWGGGGKSTRPTTSRPDGAPAHPSAVTLFVARPELPSDAKYFGRHNFNQMMITHQMMIRWLNFNSIIFFDELLYNCLNLLNF